MKLFPPATDERVASIRALPARERARARMFIYPFASLFVLLAGACWATRQFGWAITFSVLSLWLIWGIAVSEHRLRRFPHSDDPQ